MMQAQEIISWLGDLIKNLSWQQVVLILALAYRGSVKSLRQNLKEWICRINKIKFGRDGLEVEASPADQQKKISKIENANQDSGVIKLKDFPTLPRTEAIASVEYQLHDAVKGVSENDKVDILIRNLAQARLEAAFGIVYAVIFGSQISGLIELAARRKVSAQEVFEFFKPYEEKYPEIYTEYKFSGWSSFLINRGLIEVVGDDIRITDIGDDFLTWLRVKGLGQNKAY